ncbi:MAG: FAD:protein FMN transferase [Dokdonia sp.]|nr:FAD:protein FMN transferase [Dokdonia sp.]
MRIIFSLFCLLCISCGTQESPDEITLRGEAFGTTYGVIYYGAGAKAPLVQKGIDSVIYVVNKSMSTYISQSDISKINKGDTTVVVDDMFKEVFTLSRKVYETTNHYFDPTVGGLRNAYGFGDAKPITIIDSATLDSMMQYVGFNKIEISPKGTLHKKYPEVYLDFNAIAKGYGIDRIAVYLESRGLQDFLIELGGEIRASGRKQDTQRAWNVGVESVDSESENRSHVAVVGLDNKSMASSGNYRKNRIDERTGKQYVHTINPLTGSAEKSDILGATVIAPDCATADAYATAFMAMGLERSMAVLGDVKEVEAYLVFAKGSDTTGTYVTAGFEKLLLKRAP